ncbi:MAG: ACT domain-containing protein, partial [Brevundimonas sp.]
ALVERARREGAAVEALPPETALESTARVAVAALDRPGLFADLAATLAKAGADVVGARLATAEDGTALDVFEIQDGAGEAYGRREPRRLAILVKALERAAQKGARASAVETPRVSARRAVFDVRPVVRIDTETGASAVVVEVSGPDRPGLLADLARTISEHAYSTRSAHVASFGERAVDGFYITDADGNKPTDAARLEALKTALIAVLDRTLQGPAGRRIVPVRASVRDVSDLEGALGRKPVSSGSRAR